MSESVWLRGKKITFYECKDCKMVMDRTETNRPNGKFCEPKCKEYIDLKEAKNELEG